MLNVQMRKLVLAGAVLLLFALVACQGQRDQSASEGPRTAQEPIRSFDIPKSMKTEHDELHSSLEQLTYAGGRTGDAARAVVAAMETHFARENEFALPPLSLLGPLSENKFDCSMTAVLAMTDRLETEMPTMLSEHKVIVEALMKLNDAATAESKRAGTDFAEKLIAHAQGEEEITYPTALLVGRYVKSRASQCPR